MATTTTGNLPRREGYRKKGITEKTAKRPKTSNPKPSILTKLLFLLSVHRAFRVRSESRHWILDVPESENPLPPNLGRKEKLKWLKTLLVLLLLRSALVSAPKKKRKEGRKIHQRKKEQFLFSVQALTCNTTEGPIKVITIKSLWQTYTCALLFWELLLAILSSLAPSSSRKEIILTSQFALYNKMTTEQETGTERIR